MSTHQQRAKDGEIRFDEADRLDAADRLRDERLASLISRARHRHELAEAGGSDFDEACALGHLRRLRAIEAGALSDTRR